MSRDLENSLGPTHNPRPLPVPSPLPAAFAPSDWSRTLGVVAESLTLLAAGFLFLTFMQTKSGGANGDLIGVRDHDGWYHTKMASLLPEIGATKSFPWLQYVYFRQTSDDFVSHHFGFHVFLMPFLALARWIEGDILPGGRWAVAACFGGVLLISNLILRHFRVPWRWLWFALLLILPHQFFLRLGYVRAIGPSLLAMLLVVYFLTTRRPIAAGFAVAIYNQLYLGGVMFSAVLVAVFVACDLIGPEGERRFSPKMLISCVVGWLVGVFAYPYVGGMREFLWLQVFGTGLSPDIEVGQEWKPYQGVWWFIEMAGALLGIWAFSLLLRLRFGPPLGSAETALMVLNFGFLLLTCKSRRFIEYWPAFGWLSAAALAGPVIAQFAARWERATNDEERAGIPWVRALAVWGGLIGVAGLLTLAAYRDVPYLSSYLSPYFRDPRFDWLRELLGDWRFRAAVLLVAAMAWLRAIDLPNLNPLRYLSRLGDAVFVTALLLICTLTVGGRALAGTRNDLRADYDTTAIKKMMAAIQADSQPGDIIFTDDWDCFGVYFYHNSKNHYIVGLDPKFTHERRPDLWERYVKVTRGQAPAHCDVKWPARGGKPERKEKIRVDLHDIRDHFRARYVIVDDDHKPLARQLAKDTDFAEMIYPCKKYDDCDDQKYFVLKVREAPPPATTYPAADPARPDAALPGEIRYLCAIGVNEVAGRQVPSADKQPAAYSCNKSLSGGTLRAGRESHLHGVAQRAGTMLEVQLPPGFANFEATLGATGIVPDRPIRIAVKLDGRAVFELTTKSPADLPMPVEVPLGDAKRLQLEVMPVPDAGATATGGAPAEVAWASARVVATP